MPNVLDAERSLEIPAQQTSDSNVAQSSESVPEVVEAAESDEQQLAADYALILAGGPDWHIAFKRFRRAFRLGQKKVAKRMGIHPTTITKWEHGRSQPTRETRARVLAAIGWTPPPPPAREEAPNTVHVPANRRIREEEYLPRGRDWEPQRSQPTAIPRRPHRTTHHVPSDLLGSILPW